MIPLDAWAQAHKMTLIEAQALVDSGRLAARKGRVRADAEVRPPPVMTLAEIAALAGLDQADVSAALKTGMLRAQARASVEAWVAAGAPIADADAADIAYSGALTPLEVQALRRQHRSLRVELDAALREVARLRLEVARLQGDR